MATYEPIAVIGASLRFPGCDDLGSFWTLILSGRSALTRFDPVPTQPNYVPTHGVVGGIEQFDAELFGYSPREAQLIDPQQRKFLECAWEALEGAGYPSEPDDRLFGVVAGVGQNMYYLRNILPNDDLTNEFGETATLVASEKDHVATRVAHRIGLTGPSMTVQTSCSTSLVAVHLACRTLQAGDADVMIAGGASLQVPQTMGHIFTPDGILSRDGECRPFDVNASGTTSGSGVGVVVLKRFDEAAHDGDHILGVIAGSAVNNDGSNKVGYTAPSVPGQVSVIRRALAEAGVGPSQVGYVETHGTGTQLGDAIEFEALREALGSGEASCALGTLKSQIGHLDSAAGVAALIKAMLVVDTGVVPPNVNFERPNPHLDMESTRFEMSPSSRVWPAGHVRRWAGVSSFGLGGTNAHVLLRQPDRTAVETAPAPEKTVILPISAKTAASAEAALRELPRFTSGMETAHATLASAARTLQHHRRELPYRAALVCVDASQVALHGQLEQVSRVLRNPRLGFMFTGYGAQWPGMCAGLVDEHPAFAAALREAQQALRDCNVDLSDDLPRTAAEAWRDPKSGQPMLFAAQYAFGKLMTHVVGEPEFTFGHSLGEYAAMLFAGGIELPDAARLVAARSELLSSVAGLGGMTSVAATEDDVAELLVGQLVIAARNAPRAIVVSGSVRDLEGFETRATAVGIKVKRLDIDVAAHSPHLDTRISEFQALAASIVAKPLERRFISTLDGRVREKGDTLDAAYWTHQLRDPVEFRQAVEQVGKRRGTVVVEVGAGQALTTFVRQTPSEFPIFPIPTLPTSRDDFDPCTAWAQGVARLWTCGFHIDWEHAGGPGAEVPRISMPTYAFEPATHWIASEAGIPHGKEPIQDFKSARPAPRSLQEPDTGETDVAAAVAQRWAALLGTDTPENDTNFFEVGGDSLLLIRLTAQLRETFGVTLPLRDTAARATVSGISELIVRLRSNQ